MTKTLAILLLLSLVVGCGSTVSQADLDRWEQDLKEGTPEEKIVASLEMFETLNAVMTTVTDVDSAKAALEDLKKIKPLVEKAESESFFDEVDPAEKKRLMAKYDDRVGEVMKDVKAQLSRIRKASKEAFEIINNFE